MSEDALWTRIRSAIGHRGHFTRVEFNPTAGIPDVCYVIHGTEGWLELKFREDVPARITTTPVFHSGGLRDEQVAWIYTHVRHGGRAHVLAQVESMLYLVPGSFARTFNAMTMHQLAKASEWQDGGRKIDWNFLVKKLKG